MSLVGKAMMDLQELAAWGELIGGIGSFVAAIAVVASLLFVGSQIRSNTETTRLVARQTLLESLQRNSMAAIENPQLAEIFVAASRNEEITPVQTLQLHQFLRSYTQSEQTYTYLRAHNFITEEQRQGQLNVLRKTVTQPYYSKFWRRHSDEYEPAFAASIEEMIADANTVSS
jgi:hypothetical protein